ncbi:MAG: SDR family oxidoreductase [Eubacteriales bacterium]|nr:SDR family oxidoreductase [Eubacteriales bacterium]
MENVGAGRKNYALITGASSGIGMEFARRLSLEGYPLILIARRRDRLESLRNELGTECLLLPADLARREDLIRLCEDLVGRRIDIFINNAGFGVSGPFLGSDLMREVNMIDVNVTAQHVLLKYVLHRMQNEGGGYILNVASSAGLFPAGPFMAGYYATKAYMASLTRAVAEELRQGGSPVYVGCLCPGPVNTEFNEVADVTFALPGISAEECVDYALRMMEKRRVVIIPSAQIRAAVFAQRLIPSSLTVRITASQQKKKMQPAEPEPSGTAE